MRMGDACRIGELMDESQRIFDTMIASACPDELTSPILHKVLADKRVRELCLGAKGVGSHGDGTVQMVCMDAQKQQALSTYLNEIGFTAYTFVIKAQRSVRKAVIPVAGFGTRMFPATKVIKKEFLPVIDRDGLAKPALLVLLDELDKAGIEEIALIIHPDDKPDFDKFFVRDLTIEYYRKLSREMRDINMRIQRISRKIVYIY
jgi:hypothetical protein